MDVVVLYDINNVFYMLFMGDNFVIVYLICSEDIYDVLCNCWVNVMVCIDDGDGDCSMLDDSDDIVQLLVIGQFVQSLLVLRVYLVDWVVSFCVY